MSMSIKYLFLAAVFSVLSCMSVSAQDSDRRDVRRGNRDFRKEDYKAAEIDYRKAIVKDSASFAAGYNLGNTLYRMGDKEQAGKIYDKIRDAAALSPYAADYYYNTGNVVADAENWQAAVDAYRQALLRNPSDMDAKENYIYARKKLEEQHSRTRTIRIRKIRTGIRTMTRTGRMTRTIRMTGMIRIRTIRTGMTADRIRTARAGSPR